MLSISRMSLVVKGSAVDEISTVKILPPISMDWLEAYMYAYMYQVYAYMYEHGKFCDYDIRVIYPGISTKLRGMVAPFALYRLVKFYPSPI
jgi:hypothetical protein